MADNKFHLWIPEQEIDAVEKVPTGRSNQYGLEHTDHGEKLSQGLQEIVDFFQHIQTSDSLEEKDLVTFKVILQEKEDFASQKDFIENEGLTINAVKDSRHAIVSAPKDIFDNLQKRVSRYRDKGTKKDFQYIEGFEPFSAEDKKTASILRYIKDNPDAVAVDVQMMLLPDMAPDVQKRAEENITAKIKQKNGTLQGDPYKLTDGTSIIRANLSPSGLNEIAKDPRVYRVERTAFFHSLAPSDVSPFTDGLKLDPNIDTSVIPAVVVLDDGVDLPSGLQGIVPIHWQASGCTKVPNNDIGLAQALLYNGVIPLYDRASIEQDELDLAGNMYGRGLSSPQNSMYSSENKVSFINSGTMNRLTKKHVKFHIPSAIADLKVKRGKKKIRVTVTCIAQPPVDRTKGSEYSAAYISASIHRLNSNGVNVVDNPSVSDNRNKWNTCYHFSNEFSSFDSGSWEVWLELFTRWGIEDDEEIPYSLVITVEDLTEANNLYSEIIRETAGRFTQVQPVRITIR